MYYNAVALFKTETHFFGREMEFGFPFWFKKSVSFGLTFVLREGV